MSYPDPTLYAIPLFVASLFVEPLLLRRVHRPSRPPRGYDRRDRNASLGMGLGSLLFATAINFLTYKNAEWLWPHRLCDLGSGVAGWAVAILGVDLSYYWNHRVEHEVRLLWAGHVNHHSSRYYNLSTALRQPWTTWTGIFFYPVFSLVGVAPSMIMMSYGFNLIYQFWVHTEVIDRMPGWFEAVFNTPSHHRVHHGSNAEYLDRNYGGILIVWDRVFGSFEPERAPVEYGLRKNIESFNLLTIAFHEYRAIFRDLASARSARDRIGVLVHAPDWRPPSAGAPPPIRRGCKMPTYLKEEASRTRTWHTGASRMRSSFPPSMDWSPMRERESISLLLPLAFCFASLGTACSADGTNHYYAPRPDPGTTSQVVGANGGTVVAKDGTTVDIPAGALANDVTITIAPNPYAPALGQAQALNVAHLFGPEGQHFLKTITVTLEFDPTSLPPGATAQGVSVYTAPADSNFYQILATKITDATHVTAKTNDFCNMLPGANGGGTVQLSAPVQLN